MEGWQEICLKVICFEEIDGVMIFAFLVENFDGGIMIRVRGKEVVVWVIGGNGKVGQIY